jgi:FkbM family methyltransferase
MTLHESAKRFAAALGCPIYRPEEEWLTDFAKRRRDVFFLQIGAHDGKTDDKIYPMVRQYNWHGVLIEPVKYLFARLVDNYAGIKGITLENSALMETDGNAVFYYLRETKDPLPHWYDQLGSFSLDVILSHKHAIPNIEEYIVEDTIECLSFYTLIAKHNINNIDVILIDTEGYDLQILRNIDFTQYHPKLIIYEEKHLSAADKLNALQLLARNGYVVHPCGSNNVAVKSWSAYIPGQSFIAQLRMQRSISQYLVSGPKK